MSVSSALVVKAADSPVDERARVRGSGPQRKFFVLKPFFVFLTSIMDKNLWQVNFLVPKIRPKIFIFYSSFFHGFLVLRLIFLSIPKNKPIFLLFFATVMICVFVSCMHSPHFFKT